MTDRLISDNIMVAFETLHYMMNYCLGNIGYMALKLDMSKAYDRVEWQYMEKVMEKMGFDAVWIKLIDGVHIHSHILSLDRWGTSRQHHTN